MHIVYLFIILFTLKISDYIIGSKITYKMKNNSCKEPLPDLLHNILPDLSNSNYFMIDDILIALVTIYFLYIRYPDFEIFKDWLILYCSIMFLRLITMSVTNLPKPSKKCSTDDKSLFLRILSGGCNDLIFSGHTVCMLLLLLFISESFSVIGKLVITLFALGFSLLVISLRNHYTVDVLLSWYITISFYLIYFNKKINFI